MARSATRDEVIAAARQVAATHPDRTVWIGIDGCGGAGKSTLARDIVATVDRAVMISIDDFWGPSVPEWDWQRFRGEVLTPLSAGRDARYMEWDWHDDVPGPEHDVAAGSVVVVEGVSATRVEAGVPWDLTVWVDTPKPVRLERALERDGPDLMHRWFDDWIPSEERYVAEQHPQERADLVVPGTE